MIGLVLAGALAIGCGPSVHNITVRSQASVAPSADHATLVVMQPTTRFGYLNLLDQNGQLVGQLHDRSATIVQLPPGNFRLYAVLERNAGSGDRIQGTLEAGHVYYATVSMRWGGINFLALTTRSHDDRWSHLGEYLTNAPMVAMDPAQVPTAVREIGDAQRLTSEIDRRVDRLDAEHAEERVLQSTDGQ
jgi:hypothetical protein